MSYNKMMNWHRKHRKGTKQPVIMHTNSGFTPSLSFLDKYFQYKAKCEVNGNTPLTCEEYYNSKPRKLY